MATNLQVEGMACGGCEENVVDALEDVAGVDEASADHEDGTATTTGDAETAALVSAVEDAGYDVAAASDD
jgi:copper chaperone